MKPKHPATEIIAKEYVRDLHGEHEMGLRIIGEEFAERLLAGLSAAGFKVIRNDVIGWSNAMGIDRDGAGPSA